MLLWCGIVQCLFMTISFIYVVQFPGGGGVGGLPYISHIGMCRPKRVGCFRCFGLKTGIDFTHFGLESGMVFNGTTGVYERIYCFNSK